MTPGNATITPLNNRESISRDLIAWLFDFSKPKYLFDDLYHFSGRHYARHAQSRNMLPVVKFMLTKIADRTLGQGVPLMLVPEAITNGKLYYDLAEKHASRIRADRDGRLSTYRLSEILNKGELDLLTEKNKNRAMERLEGFQKLFPGAMVVSPTGMEAMLHTLVAEPGFSNRQSLRDEDFEAFWIGVCLIAQMGGFADEVAYSRNGNFETFALFQTRYGLIPFRPGGDVDIVFPDRGLVRPFDYLHMLTAHIEDVVSRGFTADLSLKMALRVIMLEDMRTTRMAHPIWGRLDETAMNPALRDLPADHDRDFAALKNRLIALIAEQNIQADLGDLFGLDGYDGLAAYADRLIKDRAPAMAVTGGGPDGGSGRRLDMTQALISENLRDKTVLQIPYQHDGDFFSQKSGLFHEAHFERTAPVARIALKALLGLHETPKAPLDHLAAGNPGEIFILFDRRGGAAGERHARDRGLILPEDARGLSRSFEDENFEASVKARNIAALHDAAARIRAWAPQSLLTTSEDIERDAENFSRNRQAFAAPGGVRLESVAKIALTEELLLRHGRIALFDDHWENRAFSTALRLHARKIQLGLIRRPHNMPPHGLTVGDIAPAPRGQAPFTVKTLIDDIRVMATLFDRLIDSGTADYPRFLVKGLLETITFADLYYNAGLNRIAAPGSRPLIDWQSVPMALKAGLDSARDDFIELKARTKNLILSHGLTALSPDDVGGALAAIDPDYERAKALQDARQNQGRSRRTRPSTSHTVEGFNAAKNRL